MTTELALSKRRGDMEVGHIKFNEPILDITDKMKGLGFAYINSQGNGTTNLRTTLQDGQLIKLDAGQFSTSYDVVENRYGYKNQKVTTNLCKYSEGNNTNWNGAGDVNGTLTNLTVTESVLDFFSNYIYVSDSSVNRSATKKVSLVNNTVYTVSCFVKMSDLSEPDIGISNSTGDFCFVDDITILTSVNKYRLSPTSDWYRVYATFTAASTGTHSVGIDVYMTQSIGSFFVSGFQIEESSFPTDYMQSENSTIQRTIGNLRAHLWINYVIDSGDLLSTSAWSNSGLALVNGIQSGRFDHKGGYTGFFITEGTTNTTHRIYQTMSASSFPQGTLLTYSVSVKLYYHDCQFIKIQVGNAWIIADLLNGSVGGVSGTHYLNATNITVTEVGNLYGQGYFMFAFCVTQSSQTPTINIMTVQNTHSLSLPIVTSFTGTGRGFYICEPQVEIGLSPTNWINTTNTETLFDVPFETISESTPYRRRSLIRKLEPLVFTMYAEVKQDDNLSGTVRPIARFDATSGTYVIGVDINTSNNIEVYVRNSATITRSSAIGATPATSGVMKIAISVYKNKILCSVNGATANGIASVVLPKIAHVLRIGSTTTGTEPFSGWIYDFRVMPTALRQHELNLLTAL